MNFVDSHCFTEFDVLLLELEAKPVRYVHKQGQAEF